ncbi:MAG: suppressor of fused domain protein [Zoogloeaceae bacterium]|jgi:hypothetical protein|nr:suppressor of fused domain protein [Zoogloeaceae bacterium]
MNRTTDDLTALMQTICAEESWAELNRAFSGVYGEPCDQYANMPYSDFLIGYSIFNGAGHRHVVSYGLAQQHRMDGKAYELTIKLPLRSPFMWTFDVLSAAAQYMQEFCGDVLPQHFDYGHSLKENSGSELAALLFLPDQTLREARLSTGQAHFLQAVGITRAEYQALAESSIGLPELIARLRVKNPLRLTQIKRRTIFLE